MARFLNVVCVCFSLLLGWLFVVLKVCFRSFDGMLSLCFGCVLIISGMFFRYVRGACGMCFRSVVCVCYLGELFRCSVCVCVCFVIAGLRLRYFACVFSYVDGALPFWGHLFSLL